MAQIVLTPADNAATMTIRVNAMLAEAAGRPLTRSETVVFYRNSRDVEARLFRFFANVLGIVLSRTETPRQYADPITIYIDKLNAIFARAFAATGGLLSEDGSQPLRAEDGTALRKEQ